MEKNNKLKILNILGGAKQGGAEKFFERLSLAIEKKKNINLKLIIRENEERFSFLKQQIKSIHQIKNFYFFNPLCHKKIDEIIKNFKPNIVLSWMNRASKILPKSKGWINIGRMGGYYKIKNYVNCDFLITNTNDLKSFVIESGWDAKKVECIPNFVTSNNKTLKTRQTSSKIILCLARFHRNKGIDILLKAMTYLDGYNLRIVGEGKEKAYYDQIVKKHGLEKKVFFYKWTNNISEFLNLADILVCPSRHEPFGNVVVDGWAHKVPVIASDTGGPGALIRNKINGLKFQNEDFFDLIEKIKFIDSQKTLVKKIVNNGYKEYKSNFSEDLIINKYINFFEKIQKKCVE